MKQHYSFHLERAFSRRRFIQSSVLGIAGLGILSGCTTNSSSEGGVLGGPNPEPTVPAVPLGHVLDQLPLQADIWSLAWSPNSLQLAIACDTMNMTHPIYVYDLDNLSTPLYMYPDHTNTVRGISWSPDGAILVSCDDAGLVRVWQPKQGGYLFSYQITPMGNVINKATSVAWSPDGNHIAAAFTNVEGVHVLDSASGQKTYQFPGNMTDPYVISWTKDSSRIFSSDSAIYSWDALTGNNLRTFDRISALYSSVRAFLSPDNSHLAIPLTFDTQYNNYGTDVIVDIWDVSAQPEQISFHYDYGSGGILSDVCWSPDSQRVASVTNYVKLWNAKDGGDSFQYMFDQTQTLSSPQAASVLAWSPDGKFIAVSYEGVVFIIGAG